MQYVKPLVSAGLDVAGGAIKSVVGSGLGALFGSLSAGKAEGGTVFANSVQEVNERGPELLQVAGRQYLMMGGQGGNVVPNSQLGNTFAPVYNIDARGADAGVEARVMRAIQQVQRGVPAQVAAAANRGGSMAKAVGRR